MDRRLINAIWIARFIHIVILAAIVAAGIHFGSRALVAGLTAVWFALFGVVYLLMKRRERRRG